MRRLLAAAAIAAALFLGLIQVASDAAFGSLADPASLPGLLGRTFGLSLVELIDARVPTTWSTTTLAQAALLRKNGSVARAAIARLAPGDRREDLIARLAQLDGDDARALAAFLSAGDANNVFPAIARLAARGDLPGAIALDERLVERLRRDASHPANYVDALITLGDLYARTARATHDPPPGRQSWRASLDAYQRARALQPIDVTVLVGIGDAEAALGNDAAAHAAYREARRLDPLDPSLRGRHVR